jgi:hypothetical protein
MNHGTSRIRLLLLPIWAFAVLVISCGQKKESAGARLTKDEIQVVEVVLEYVRAEGALGADTVVVRKAPAIGRRLSEEIPSPYKVAWQQLYEVVDVNRYIDGLSRAGINAISSDERISRAKQDKKLSPRDRRGYVHVSPPEVDGDRAVIFCSWAKGDLGGESVIFMLKRAKHGWVIYGKRLIAES